MPILRDETATLAATAATASVANFFASDACRALRNLCMPVRQSGVNIPVVANHIEQSNHFHHSFGAPKMPPIVGWFEKVIPSLAEQVLI